MRLAAIDIGSNAARLLISEVQTGSLGKPEFIKLSLVRVPLRLGFDVFDTGFISNEKAERLIKTIEAYKLLLEVYDVQHLATAATSAMRDARNANEVLHSVAQQTGITLRVITGSEEAAYIYENHVAENLNPQQTYLYIDVGGGSTELSFFNNGKLTAKESFNVGTIRLLKNQVAAEHWGVMKSFIKAQTNAHQPITAIGSGGNINKVFSLTKKKEGKPLSLEMLRNYYNEFSSISVDQRINLYRLKQDRADVIVPALLVYINVMHWAGAAEIFVPKIGLADGLIHLLFEKLSKGQPAAL